MENTEIKLLESLSRVLNGTVVNIDKQRKLSFSSVEDEALVGRSLSRHYPEVFKKIKEEIEKQKTRKVASTEEIISNHNLKEENRLLKEQIKMLKKEKEELISANVSLAERVIFLNKRIK